MLNFLSLYLPWFLFCWQLVPGRNVRSRKCDAMKMLLFVLHLKWTSALPCSLHGSKTSDTLTKCSYCFTVFLLCTCSGFFKSIRYKKKEKKFPLQMLLFFVNSHALYEKLQYKRMSRWQFQWSIRQKRLEFQMGVVWSVLVVQRNTVIKIKIKSRRQGINIIFFMWFFKVLFESLKSFQGENDTYNLLIFYFFINFKFSNSFITLIFWLNT